MSAGNYDMNPNELKAYLKHFGSSLLRTTSFMLGVARRNIIWLVLAGALAAGCSYFFLQRATREYTFRMSCAYNDNNPKIFGEMLAQIDLLLQNADYQTASLYLEMPLNQVKQLVSVRGKTISMGRLEEDYAGTKAPFYVEAVVQNPGVIPTLEKKILSYLNHNDFSVRSVQRQRAKWQSRVSFYQQQIAKLDSLKEEIRLSYQQSPGSNINLAQQNNSVVDIYKLSDSLSFFLADVQYYLQHYETVQPNYGFRLASMHSFRSVAQKSLLYAIIAVILTWLFLASRTILRKAEA